MRNQYIYYTVRPSKNTAEYLKVLAISIALESTTCN